MSEPVSMISRRYRAGTVSGQHTADSDQARKMFGWSFVAAVQAGSVSAMTANARSPTGCNNVADFGAGPVQDPCRTRAGPVQDPCRTRAGPVQEPWRTGHGRVH